MKRIYQPLLSVVIPTTGRRHSWLIRAVNSALEGWKESECEVLIILNVNFEKYELLSNAFKKHPEVSIKINKLAGASSARNLGIQLASGEIIRFLDDDDYLYPGVAVAQVKELSASDANLSSYGIDLVNEDGYFIESRQPLNTDCIPGLCAASRLQIPVSFAYKLTSIQHCRWQEDLSLAEDTLWLLSILEQNNNIKWIRRDISVGVWFQHQTSRLSKPYSTNRPAILIASKLIEIGKKLPKDSAYDSRLSVIAEAAWSCFLAGFKYSPITWSHISKSIFKLKPSSTPKSKIYQLIPINPLFLSWILLPAFWANHAFKLLSFFFVKKKFRKIR